jgi:hypothetical protein
MTALRASVVVLMVVASTMLYAQTAAPGSTYRVFLDNGQALPSYGEPTEVGERLIFHLIVGTPASLQWIELMSLPRSAIDLERTNRYTRAMRAAQYGATRGDVEYAAMGAEVARALDQLAAIPDPRRRLELAQEARRRLLDWSRDHFDYRAADIQELSGLFDEVINQLQVATGAPELSFELVAGRGSVALVEPLMPPPSLRESIELALSAADAADSGTERVSVLRTAAAAASTADADAGRLRELINRRLADETKANDAYAALSKAIVERAEAARKRGDAPAVSRLQHELARRDRQLGQRRPAEVAAVAWHLTHAYGAALEVRRQLEDYRQRRPRLQEYERRVRPILSGIERLAPILGELREARTVSPTDAREAEAALDGLVAALARVEPPGALAAGHATLDSALRMAREACVRRWRMQAGNRLAMSREASAAAAGALLLAAQARSDLESALRPPAIQ